MASAQVRSFESAVFEGQSKEFKEQQEKLEHLQNNKQQEDVPQDDQNHQLIDEALYEVEYKHPLEHVWTLWYLENDRTKHWKDMLNEITQIDSVETFWSLYYTIKTPSELKIGCDYSMFKKDIKPMWEDVANIKGGRWLVTVGKSAKLELDRIWLDILLMMVGQAFEYSDEICGAVINIRAKSNKISVWTANGNSEMAILEIGQKLKMLLRLQSHNLQYQLHSDAMCKINSCVKSVYTL
ncbi:eukaryotic translation initiation factor 4E1 [Drosophila rhopaloa]|uniref:eIF-4F 25 kDa subunit n=1 Tax=Drosophila rhopaloa TaxID=1041015 RepID=A0ABM5H1P4_DRORH|nr:eukaryotic translation initiation factor 4E1 [Drosophila rhopaloa]